MIIVFFSLQKTRKVLISMCVHCVLLCILGKPNSNSLGWFCFLLPLFSLLNLDAEYFFSYFLFLSLCHFNFSAGPLQYLTFMNIFCVKSNKLRFFLLFLSFSLVRLLYVCDLCLLMGSIVFDLNGSFFL